jgi:hypothetical protein
MSTHVQKVYSRIRTNPQGVQVEYSNHAPAHYAVEEEGYYIFDSATGKVVSGPYASAEEAYKNQ